MKQPPWTRPEPCPLDPYCRHQRDPFVAMRCWKCGGTMRAPAMRGSRKVKR